MILLHDFWLSSASYRVRIALNLKGVDYRRHAVDLLARAQEQPDYIALNPQGLVPMLEIDGHRLTQSLAIIDYLDARFPEPHLVPRDPAGRSRVLSMAITVAADVHPLNNLRVLRYLKRPLGHDQQEIDDWARHWLAHGFAALDAMLAQSPATGRFAHGDMPGLAEICIVPQLYNARRINLDLAAYPTLVRIADDAAALDAFAAAHPDAVRSDG
jgi:maleylacetoacetate isomerase